MSLERIVSHIIAQADAEGNAILAQAKAEADGILVQARMSADERYRQIMQQEERSLAQEQEKAVVAARLEAKKRLLGAKHELISEVFRAFTPHVSPQAFKQERVTQQKTEQVSRDAGACLDDIRFAHEVEVARILFKG